MKRILTIAIVLFASLFLYSQENTWINYDQQYIKIQVVKDGIYRISKATLASHNFPINVINANGIQLFHNGEEQYIYISGIASDGTMANNAYIEFYGQRNRGDNEDEFYDSPSSKINPDVSLYNDTAAYFLTWNNLSINRRMTVVSDNNYSNYLEYAPKYCIKHVRTNFTGRYNRGCSRNFITEGEGWVDASNVTSASLTKTISTPKVYTAGPNAEFEFAITGISSTSETTSYVLHQLAVACQNTAVLDTLYTGYQFIRKDFSFPTSRLSSSTSLKFTASGTDNDKNAISYIDIKYPHTWDFEAASSLEFTLVPNNLTTKDYIEFRNFGTTENIVLYNLTNHERTTISSDLKALVGNTTQERNMILCGEGGYLEPAGIVQVSSNNKFVDYIAQNNKANFVIVTHKKFMNGANEYAAYRNLTGYSSLVADIDQLYDQYTYGVNKHPGAIRRFCNVVYNLNPTEKYLFLIGRALYNGTDYNVKTNTADYEYDKVPTAGSPGSDVLLTVGLGGTTNEPLFRTGRLGVVANNEITAYLNKVRIYENLEPEMWTKEMLFFGGGKNASEQSAMSGYLQSYANTIEDTLYGGRAHIFQKNTSTPIYTTQTDSINDLINNGVSVMTFFGHGSSTTFDHDIQNPEFYHNQDRFPFMIANCCYAGGIHSKSTITISDTWVKSSQGAIGFLSSINTGVASYLHSYTNEFFKNFSYKHYNQSIGNQIVNTIKYCFNSFGNSFYNEITCYEITLHGDPSIVIKTGDKPDLMIDNSSVSFSPNDITTIRDSFDVVINIKNRGKSVTRPFSIFVERVLANGEEEHYETIAENCLYEKNVSVRIPTNRINGTGINSIRIFIDAMNDVDELDETNNYVSIDFIIRSSDIFPIYPYEYAIYPNKHVTLFASTGDCFAPSYEYKFQIDTTDSFDSPLLNESIVSSTGGIVNWNVPVTLIENRVYYWRVALNAQNDSIVWKESSFIYIEGEEGWSQAHYYQFKNDKFHFVEYNRETQYFTFSRGLRQLNCHNRSTISYGTYEEVTWGIDNNLSGGMGAYGGCNTGAAMVAVVIDPETLMAWQSDRQNYGHRNYPQCFSSTSPQSYFTFDITTRALDSLNSLLLSVPNGYYILLYSWRQVAFTALPNQLIQTMNSMGALQIQNVANNVPYIFCTRKGTPSIYREVYGTTSNDVIDMEPLTLISELKYGYIESVKVGPSNRWKSFTWYQEPNENNSADEIKISIYGIDNHSNETLLIDSIIPENYNLYQLDNIIDYHTYPNVKLNMYTRDTVTKTPAQLKKWQLKFDGVPETAIDAKLGYFFHSDTIDRGDDIVFAISTKNISSYDMDSLIVKYWLSDSRNNIIPICTKKLRPHPSQDVITDTIRYSSINLHGLYSLWVEFNPINEATGTYYQVEQYHFNNIATKHFYVNSDITNPLLEVSFDGRYIMNGEIVSAKPEILITLKDENKYLELNDTSLFEIFITTPSGVTKRVNFNIQENPYETLEWIPAELPNNSCKIIYKPIFAEDGVYTLQVHAKDVSGNISGDNDYIIDFEIITKSTITNLLNYPNPFSSQTRFVFDLTGSEIPDELKIEIFTVTGKVVKVIYLEDLGHITIGRNVTEYAWDGRDMFGDKLDNGVYFYKVTAKINGEDIEKRNNGTDKFFKREVGKMYILR